MRAQSSKNQASSWLVSLNNHGYRLTRPRRAVVNAIANSRHVLTPFDVFELARQSYPKLGLVTVYRTIEKLEELGLIQRVHRPSGCQAFIAASQNHEHLVICQLCGKVAFFQGDGEGIGTLITEVSQGSGYQINEHWLQLFGTCHDCQSKDG